MLEHMLNTLDRGPLQTDVRQVVGGASMLGQYELRVGIQFLKQSSYLLRIRSCRVVHGAHTARQGNGSFEVLRQAPGLHSGSLPQLPDLPLPLRYF